MDTEVISQLISMLEGAGEGTFWLVLVYIFQGYFTVIVKYSFVFAAILVIARTISRSIGFASDLEKIRSLVPPTEDISGHMTDGEINDIIKWISSKREQG